MTSKHINWPLALPRSFILKLQSKVRWAEMARPSSDEHRVAPARRSRFQYIPCRIANYSRDRKVRGPFYSMRIDPSVSSHTSSNIYGSVLQAFLFIRDMGTYQQQDRGGFCNTCSGCISTTRSISTTGSLTSTTSRAYISL